MPARLLVLTTVVIAMATYRSRQLPKPFKSVARVHRKGLS
jgi:hypothetical protein